MARRHRPSLAIVDASLPEIDGLALAEGIHKLHPLASIVIVARSFDAAMLRRAMRAGVREVLVEPLDAVEIRALVERLRPILEVAAAQQRERRGQVIVTASNKGGVGKTTIATNLAVGLRRASNDKVALVDLDLDFGDVGTVLDLKQTRTIADLAPYADRLDTDLLEGTLAEHSSGVKVLPAPRRGQETEGIGGNLVGQVLGLLGETYPHIVVDTGTNLDEAVLAALDVADRVLLVTTLDVVSLKNVSQMLDLLQRLAYPLDKVRLVANRWNGKGSVSRQDAESTLGLPFAFLVPSDYARVIDAVNRGLPFVNVAPQAPISRSIMDMSRDIALNGRRER
jgi:pilus assembly protein CpaE